MFFVKAKVIATKRWWQRFLLYHTDYP